MVTEVRAAHSPVPKMAAPPPSWSGWTAQPLPEQDEQAAGSSAKEATGHVARDATCSRRGWPPGSHSRADPRPDQTEGPPEFVT